MAIQDEIPKSRLTLRYKTEVNGEPEDVSLPMRMLVMGNFSLGSSKDRKLDIEERRFRNMDGRNTDGVMKDMGMSLDFSVANKLDPSGEGDIQVKLPVTGIDSFSPDAIAENVPKLKGILMVKRLLEEVVSNVDNRKDFRKLLGELMGDEEALKKLTGELEGFEAFKLPAGVCGKADAE